MPATNIFLTEHNLIYSETIINYSGTGIVPKETVNSLIALIPHSDDRLKEFLNKANTFCFENELKN